MNVSFTRARSKLIIFGSRKTLQGTPLLKEFFELMDEKGWVLNVPSGAHTFHASMLCDESSLKHREVAQGTEMGVDTKEESKVTPSKRNLEERENVSGGLGPGRDKDARAVKKLRKSYGVDEGILKGKPLLQDLVNEQL